MGWSFRLELVHFAVPVGGEDDTPPLFSDVGKNIPEIASCGRIHTSSGLILCTKQEKMTYMHAHVGTCMYITAAHQHDNRRVTH